MSQLKVNTIRHTSATSDAITLANDGTATARITNYPHRNLIINGGCIVAQRTGEHGSAVTTNGYGSVDRFKVNSGGTDELPSHQHHLLTSSDTGPWEKGFKNSLQITNGNQSSGAGADDDLKIIYNIEARDVAQSGWDYKSPSSYVTLQFWVKSSVAQNFYCYLQTFDGSGQRYPFETGSLTANTWKKVTKTIPGHANIDIDNNTGKGLAINFGCFLGTGLTGSTSLDTWGAWNTNIRTPDNTSTWWTTNDANFELTGIQLEVGDTATDFEHRSYGDELARCQRYLQYSDESAWHACIGNGSSNCHGAGFTFQVPMRAQPSVSATSVMYTDHDSYTGSHSSTPTVSDFDVNGIALHFPSLSGCDDNRQGQILVVHTNRIKFDAEL